MGERKSDVAEAFELLLDALEEERKRTAEALSQIALTEGVQAAQQVLQRLKFLEQTMDRFGCRGDPLWQATQTLRVGLSGRRLEGRPRQSEHRLLGLQKIRFVR